MVPSGSSKVPSLPFLSSSISAYPCNSRSLRLARRRRSRCPLSSSRLMPCLTMPCQTRLVNLATLAAMRDEIYKALEQVIDPELRRPVTELDMVRDIRIDGGEVAITIALTVAGCPLRASFEEQVQRAVA